jgi:UDP-glucose 4-epimerase
VLTAAIGSDESVVVTGVVGRLGKRVVRLLHRMVRVIGVDRREFPDRPKDVSTCASTCGARRCATCFARATCGRWCTSG